MKTSALTVILLFASLAAAGVLLTPATVQAEEGAHASSGSGGISSPIPMKREDFKTDLAFWTLVVFVLLLLILAPWWKKAMRGLDQREQGIADQISQAEESNRQAKEQLAAYEKRLAEAGVEVRELIAQGRREAERAGQELLDKARAEAKAEQARSLRQIEAAETAALKNLADRGASLAIELAGKIVHAKLSRKEHESLIEEAVSRFAEAGPAGCDVGRN